MGASVCVHFLDEMRSAELLGKLPIAVAAIAAAVFFVFLRLSQTLPAVMQDEYVYMVQTHLQPVSANGFGNFLHSFVYSSVFLFGDFYLATKVLNSLFLIIFAFAVLFLARRFLAYWLAALISVGTVLSATSMYSSVLMPEVMFFAFSAWAVTFLVFAIETTNKRRYLLSGLSVIALSFAGLTKPHAIILVLGLVLALGLLVFMRRQRLVDGLIHSSALLVGYLALKLGIGYLLAGSAGFTVLGANYEKSLRSFLNQIHAFNEGASSAAAGFINPVDAQGLSTFVLFTITHLGLLFLALMFMTLGLPIFLARPISKLTDYQLVVIVISVVYLIAIAGFTSLVTFTGDNHANRLLGRYFEFLVPFILVAVFVEIAKRDLIPTPRKIFLGLGSVVLAIGWFGIVSKADFRLADSGILLGAYREELIPWLVVVVLVLVTLIVVERPKNLVTISSVLVIATVAVIGFSAQQRQIDLNSVKIAADFAGDDLRQNYGEIPGDQVIVVGTNKQLAFVTKFWSLKADIDNLVLNPESTVSINDPLLEQYSLVVELPGVTIEDGNQLSAGDGYRILGKPERN